MYLCSILADGNCLANAVSQSMWGIEDSEAFLRRLLYVTMTTDPKGRFKRRWLIQQRYATEEIGMGLRLNTDVSSSCTYFIAVLQNYMYFTSKTTLIPIERTIKKNDSNHGRYLISNIFQISLSILCSKLTWWQKDSLKAHFDERFMHCYPGLLQAILVFSD